MKQLTIILLIIISPLFWRGAEAFAQKPDSAKKQLGLVLKADILRPIYGLLFAQNYASFTVEKLVKKRHSVQLTFFEYWGHQNDEWKFNQWALIPEYKFLYQTRKLIQVII